MDLSKAFNTLNDGLLKAKRHVYGLNKELLKFIFGYLSDR